MLNNDEHKELSELVENIARLKEEISNVIEEGRNAGLRSEVIAEDILKKVGIDNKIVAEKESRAERLVNIKEIMLLAQKAVEQAAFQGGLIILPSGEKIRMRRNTTCVYSF